MDLSDIVKDASDFFNYYSIYSNCSKLGLAYAGYYLAKNAISGLQAYFGMISKQLIEVPEYRYEQFKDLPDSFQALDYLILANYLVQKSEFSHALNNPDSEPVCRHFTFGTFKAFKELTKNNNRKDLDKNIRISLGLYFGLPKIYGHAWLELKHEGKFISFETTMDMEVLAVENIKEKALEILEDRKKLNEVSEISPSAFFRSFPGSFSGYPTFQILLRRIIPLYPC